MNGLLWEILSSQELKKSAEIIVLWRKEYWKPERFHSIKRTGFNRRNFLQQHKRNEEAEKSEAYRWDDALGLSHAIGNIRGNDQVVEFLTRLVVDGVTDRNRHGT